jgi:pyridoxal phosphate enzyme (YggS family)
LSIGENVRDVKRRIAEAAVKSGRKSEDILLVGVTKTIDVERIRELLNIGVRDLGENRPQELCEKYPVLGGEPQWHLIGHLQTNKVKSIIDKVVLIHSVDSLRLAEEINKRALQRVMDVLVEINIASEPTKHGIQPEFALDFIQQVQELSNINLKGLMCVAPNVDDPEKNRYYFKKMRELLIDINCGHVHNKDLTELSMGMTNDYETAVEEGATIVRVGTGIFGSRRY